MKNTENIVKVDTKSFIEMCQKIELLESHVTALKTENEILRDENETYFETCNDLIKNIRELREENDKLNENIEAEVNNRLAKATIWDLSPEAQKQAGHNLARSLLSGNMSKADIEAEEMEMKGESHSAESWNMACGDDY